MVDTSRGISLSSDQLSSRTDAMEALKRLLFMDLRPVKTQTRWWILSLCTSLALLETVSADVKSVNAYSAIVNITYKDPETQQMRTDREDMGLYSISSRLESEWGMVVHVRTSDNRTHGCTPPTNVPPKERWIALVERGHCKFHKKIFNAAVVKNASAVAIYNHEEGELLQMRQQGKSHGHQWVNGAWYWEKQFFEVCIKSKGVFTLVSVCLWPSLHLLSFQKVHESKFTCMHLFNEPGTLSWISVNARLVSPGPLQVNTVHILHGTYMYCECQIQTSGIDCEIL